jgi:hypothetical protein
MKSDEVGGERMSEADLTAYFEDEYGQIKRRGTQGKPPYEIPYAYEPSAHELLAALRAERDALTTAEAERAKAMKVWAEQVKRAEKAVERADAAEARIVRLTSEVWDEYARAETKQARIEAALEELAGSGDEDYDVDKAAAILRGETP